MFENTPVAAEPLGQLSKVRSVYAELQRESWEMLDRFAQVGDSAQLVEAQLNAYEAHRTLCKQCFEVLLGIEATINEALLQHGEEYYDVLNAFYAESREWFKDVYKR